ncbi:hypothetical protein AB0L25_33690 [Spirillospora sp. NPDC052242]
MREAVRLFPWKMSALCAAAVTVGWLVLSLSGGDFRGILVASPLCIGIMVFFLLGGLVMVLREDGGNAAAQDTVRRLAPVLAVVPAVLIAVLVFAARRACALAWGMDETVAGSAVDGAARGAIGYVVLVGSALAARHDARKKARG